MPKRIDHETEMSFFDHLGELRSRLMICVLAIFFTTLGLGMPFAGKFLDILTQPLRSADIKTDAPLEIEVGELGALTLISPREDLEIYISNSKKTARAVNFIVANEDGTTETVTFGSRPNQSLYYSAPFDLFFILLKIAALLGIILAIPIWLYELWAFVSPAFTPAELKWVRWVFISSALLFPTGVGFAYIMLRFAFEMFFNMFQIPGVTPWLFVDKYIPFALTFMFIFGFVFQTPLVVVLLVQMGVVKTSWLRSTRQYAMLVIAIASACLTPADPFTMLAMAFPLYCLYETSIWISVILERRIQEEDAATESKWDDDWSSDDDADSSDSGGQPQLDYNPEDAYVDTPAPELVHSAESAEDTDADETEANNASPNPDADRRSPDQEVDDIAESAEGVVSEDTTHSGQGISEESQPEPQAPQQQTQDNAVPFDSYVDDEDRADFEEDDDDSKR